MVDDYGIWGLQQSVESSGDLAEFHAFALEDLSKLKHLYCYTVDHFGDSADLWVLYLQSDRVARAPAPRDE